MINQIHRALHRVEDGWDPVPAIHAQSYAESAWRALDAVLVDRLEKWLGPLEGKRVLDLGGGPGQYSVAFAQRGARVTWHDISRRYARLAAERAARHSVAIDFSLGYLEDAHRLKVAPFDLVFCRLCWYYCGDDRDFARMIYSLMRPGGGCYIECSTPEFDRHKGIRALYYFLNNHFWWKIGHPYPPRGRIAELFEAFPLDYLWFDYRSTLTDKVFALRSAVGAGPKEVLCAETTA